MVYLNEPFKIHKPTKLANQSNSQVKGTLVKEAAILMKAKK